MLSYDANFSNGAILVYDITDEDSFLKVKNPPINQLLLCISVQKISSA